MPKYVLLLHDAADFSQTSPQDMQAIVERYIAWRRGLEQGRSIGGHKLRDGEGRVMRRTDGAVAVTDGPYAEAREVIGGLFILEAASYDEAVALCRDCPHLDFGAIEVREVEAT